MTDAREELAELIRKAGWDAQDSPDYEKCGFDSDRFIADAILSAGWRAPLCRGEHTSGRAPDAGRWCTACGRRLDRVDG